MPKNIVLCCDGTNSDVTGNSTNVLRLFRSLERSESQLAYYDAGVGTISDPTQLTNWGRLISRSIDSAIGHSVRDNVCRAYRFLVENYRPQDRIFLFGFSRGAYTIRALAGMIHFLGLLRPELRDLDRLGWKIYADDIGELETGKRFEAGNRFKRSFSRADEVVLHFVGAWDTVSAFGWFWQLRTVPFTASNRSICHIRHALSIDERRAAFQPNRFRPQDPSQHSSFREVWFAGTHSDIGGGYGDDQDGLAGVTLQWMIREAESQGCLFVPAQVENFRQRLSRQSPSDWTIHESIRKFWHLLEFLPRRQWDHQYKPEGMRWFLPNLYRSRRIPEKAEVHLSAVERMQQGCGYRPKNLPQNYTVAD